MWNVHLNDRKISETKRFIPKGFELGTTYWVSRLGVLLENVTQRYLVSVQNLSEANFKHGVLCQVSHPCRSGPLYLDQMCVFQLYTTAFFLTLAMVCKYWLNAVFTVFAFQANLSKPWSFLFFLENWRNFTKCGIFFIQICYRWKSVFFVQWYNLKVTPIPHFAIIL